MATSSIFAAAATITRSRWRRRWRQWLGAVESCRRGCDARAEGSRRRRPCRAAWAHEVPGVAVAGRPVGRRSRRPDLLLLGVVEESPRRLPPTTITASLAPASHRDDENTQAPVEIIEQGAHRRGSWPEEDDGQEGRRKVGAARTTRAVAAASEGTGTAPSATPKPRRTSREEDRRVGRGGRVSR